MERNKRAAGAQKDPPDKGIKKAKGEDGGELPMQSGDLQY